MGGAARQPPTQGTATASGVRMFTQVLECIQYRDWRTWNLTPLSLAAITVH